MKLATAAASSLLAICVLDVATSDDDVPGCKCLATDCPVDIPQNDLAVCTDIVRLFPRTYVRFGEAQGFSLLMNCLKFTVCYSFWSGTGILSADELFEIYCMLLVL
jgi:hypothetical protein